MKREYVDIYTEAHDKATTIAKENKIPKARFFRECINAVLSNKELLKRVITRSKSKNYISTDRRNNG